MNGCPSRVLLLKRAVQSVNEREGSASDVQKKIRRTKPENIWIGAALQLFQHASTTCNIYPEARAINRNNTSRGI